MATPRQPPQTVAFVPQGTNQAKASRSLPLGALVEATNVRQVKEDEWRKRKGFARTVVSAAGGTYSTASPGESVYAGALVERDTAGQFWAHDNVLTSRIYRGVTGNGSGVRPFPTYQDAGIEIANAVPGKGTRRSITVLGAGGDIWVFSVGELEFQYTVTGADGSVKKAATTNSFSPLHQIAAAYHPGQNRVYVVVLGNGTQVFSHSYNATTYGLVGTAIYASGLIAPSGIDMAYLSSPGEVAVLISMYDDATPRCRVIQSYLDPATLLPKAAPAPVNTDSTPHGSNRPDFCGGVSILVSSGATSWYYSFWRASANQHQLELVLVTVTTATLATALTTVLAVVDPTLPGQEYRGVSSGYVDTATGNRIVYAQSLSNNFTTQRTYDLAVTRYTWNGSVVTALVVAKGAWLASKPCLLGGAWYFLTGREGGTLAFVGSTPAEQAFRQGDLYLRDSAGNILSQVFPGNGPYIWHRYAAPINESDIDVIMPYEAFVTTLVAPTATTLAATAGKTAEMLFSQRPVTVLWDFAAGYGPPVAIADLAIFPGPVPLATGPKDFLAELFPMHSPAVRVTFGSTGLTGVSAVCATYRFVRAGQVVYESSPSRLIPGTYWANATISVSTLKHQMTAGVTAEICVYTAPLGSSLPVLQGVKPNDPTVDAISFTMWPVAADFPGLTPLYTNGGGLSNAPLPPARCLERWRDRLHLSGTPIDGEVWHSQEFSEGAAPTFNEVLRSFWLDAQGSVLGLKAVDWNYLAAFKRNGVAAIGGPGPDGRGNQGGYVWQTLTTEKGLSDTGLASLLSTPYGATFQNEADGRLCLVSTGLQIQDLMQGADASRTLLVGPCLLHEAERQAWFYCTDGTLLVLEYAWAGETKALVNCWRRWSSASLLRAYGAVITPAGPVHVESTGVLRTQRSPASTDFTDADPGVASEILTAIETGRLPPFGLMQEGGVVGAHVLGQHLGVTNMRITVTCDDGTPSVHDKTTLSPVDYGCKPTGGFRCKEVRVRVEETISLGTEGYVFEGIALDVVPYGRTRILAVNQRIA